MASLSVVIPTCRRHTSLMRTLRSVIGQTHQNYEIIVVDNAVEQELRMRVKELRAESQARLSYVAEPTLGLQHARHTGVKAARGDVLVFTDDDATFEPTWLQSYADMFSAHPQMAAAGGPVRPIWGAPPPFWLCKYMGHSKVFGVFSLMEPFSEFRLGTDCFFFGVNMAIRRSVFEFEGFRPELVGSRTIGSGESGLNRALAKKGKLIGFVPGAVVYHHISASRMSIAYLRRWAWHLSGAYMFDRWCNRRRSTLSVINEVTSILRAHASAWIRYGSSRLRFDPRSIELQFHASLGCAKLAYLWWMLTDHQVQKVLDMHDFTPGIGTGKADNFHNFESIPKAVGRGKQVEF